jgi:hypothetical protein
MLVVKVELHPKGNPTLAMEIARGYIVNIGTGDLGKPDSEYGRYNCWFERLDPLRKKWQVSRKCDIMHKRGLGCLPLLMNAIKRCLFRTPRDERVNEAYKVWTDMPPGAA